MIIFAILTISFVFGIGLMCTSLMCTSRDENAGVVGIILAVISGVFLIICLIELVVNPIEVKGDISKFLTTKVTIEIARKAGVDLENAAIQHKIIESNRWLAKQQYYNSTIFGLWIPDKVDKLKPIR